MNHASTFGLQIGRGSYSWVQMNWFELKDLVTQSTGLDRDALHIFVAVSIQLLAALLTKRSLANVLPWLLVLLLQLGNELLDFAVEGGALAAWRVEEAIRDTVNTMALPTLLLILARFLPSLLTGRGTNNSPLRHPRPS